jgi:nucleotide-binding universal stress UspA family protein
VTLSNQEEVMEKIKKILAPTDLSGLSQVGIRYALELAREIGAEVTAYHVVNYDELIQYSEEMKEKARTSYTYRPPSSFLERYQIALARFLSDHFSDLTPWVKIRERVELGKPDENITEWAKKDGTDLIVISTHGRSGLSHMLTGRVAEKVVRTAPCPVLSIHPHQVEKAAKEAKGVA